MDLIQKSIKFSVVLLTQSQPVVIVGLQHTIQFIYFPDPLSFKSNAFLVFPEKVNKLVCQSWVVGAQVIAQILDSVQFHCMFSVSKAVELEEVFVSYMRTVPLGTSANVGMSPITAFPTSCMSGISRHFN